MNERGAMNHKEGDIVRITARRYGHRFTIGSLVRIASVGIYKGKPYNYRGTQIANGDGHEWSFEDDECTYYTETNQSAKSLLSKEY